MLYRNIARESGEMFEERKRVNVLGKIALKNQIEFAIICSRYRIGKN